MDVYCKRCGEPWDLAGVLDALNGNDVADMTREEAERLLRGEGCPCCGFGRYCPACCGKGSCPLCNGTGFVKVRYPVEGEIIRYPVEGEIMCTNCGGSGVCPRCKGTGKLEENHDEKYYEGLLEIDGEIW